MKFGRSFYMQVQGQQFFHNISYPQTVQFNIVSDVFSTWNNAKFSIYGLSDFSIKDLYYDTITLQEKIVPMSFNAGYLTGAVGGQVGPFQLPLLFKGNVTRAFTERQGPELITRIQAFDGGYGIVNGNVAVAYSPLRPFRQTIFDLIQQIPGVKPGTIQITPEPGPIAGSPVFNGSALDAIKQYLPVGAQVFIDKGVVNVLGENDTLPSPTSLQEISSHTGLLDIPQRDGYAVTCCMVFEPNIVIGQTIGLNSKFNSWVNRPDYKVIGITHDGTISGVVSGEATTMVTLQAPAVNLTAGAPVSAAGLT